MPKMPAPIDLIELINSLSKLPDLPPARRIERAAELLEQAGDVIADVRRQAAAQWLAFGGTDADLAERIGCAVQEVTQIRSDTKTDLVAYAESYTDGNTLRVIATDPVSPLATHGQPGTVVGRRVVKCDTAGLDAKLADMGFRRTEGHEWLTAEDGRCRTVRVTRIPGATVETMAAQHVWINDQLVPAGH